MKVVSIFEKLETWKTVFATPAGDMLIMSSNHGRLKFKMCTSEEEVVLDFFDSVSLSEIIASSFIDKREGTKN